MIDLLSPPGPRRLLLGPILAGALLLLAEAGHAQLSYSQGQSVSPAYEGFEVNPDGSFNLLFGYMNRNWEEELDIPIGPDNHFSPGLEDRGQPTHFLPRRNRFIFKVRVPADFGDQELVWTIRSRGEERRAYATLRQDLLVDNMVIASETGALGAGRSDPETRSNTPPTVELETDRVIDAQVGRPVTLIAKLVDDGLPLTREQRISRAREAAEAEGDSAEGTDEPDSDSPDDEDTDSAEEDEEELSPEIRALRRWLNEPNRVTVNKAVGLHFTWFVYRGENVASFDPIQIEPWEDSRAWHNSPWSPYWEAPSVPEDGRWIVNVTFDEPGTYVLRGRADDGALYADEEVTVHVRPLLP